MSAEATNKTAKIILIIGLIVLVGMGVTYLILSNNNNNKGSKKDFSEDFEKRPEQMNEVAQIQNMQQYLLELGAKNNNTIIMDAIRLTGGVDGIRGAGFNTALNEAIDRGYLESYDDLLNRVS